MCWSLRKEFNIVLGGSSQDHKQWEKWQAEKLHLNIKRTYYQTELSSNAVAVGAGRGVSAGGEHSVPELVKQRLDNHLCRMAGKTCQDK